MVTDPEYLLLFEQSGGVLLADSPETDRDAAAEFGADILEAEAEGAVDEDLGLGGDCGGKISTEVLIDNLHDLIDLLGGEVGAGTVAAGFVEEGNGGVGGFLELAPPGVVEDAVVLEHEVVVVVHQRWKGGKVFLR